MNVIEMEPDAWLNEWRMKRAELQYQMEEADRILTAAAEGRLADIGFPEGTGPLIPTNRAVQDFLTGVRRGFMDAMVGLVDWLDSHVTLPPPPDPDAGTPSNSPGGSTSGSGSISGSGSGSGS